MLQLLVAYIFFYNSTAICRQCREYLINIMPRVTVSEDISEPVQTPEVPIEQTEEQECIPVQEKSDRSPQKESDKSPQEESDKSPQEEVISCQYPLA